MVDTNRACHRRALTVITGPSAGFCGQELVFDAAAELGEVAAATTLLQLQPDGVVGPGLDIGDLLHIRSFEDTVKARVPNTWSDYMVFEHTAPIARILMEVDDI